MSGPPPRDWDKEMAEIDKLIAKEQRAGPPAPVARPPAGSAPAPQRAAAAPPAKPGRTALAVWVRVLLGVSVAAGVALAWPYPHACGWSLYGYLIAAGGVTLAGLWGVVSSWKRSMGLAHSVALLVTLTGAVLVGKVLLDRSDYVRHPATWGCP